MAAHREIVGTFQSPESLEAAIAALESAGWDRAELSLLGPKHLLDPTKDYVPETDIAADDPDAQHNAVVGKEDVRQGRTLAAGMAGTVGAFIAAGAAILSGGSLLIAVVGSAALGGGAAALVEKLGNRADEKREDFLDMQLGKGGILLWATLDERDEAKAREILERFGATNVRAHEVAGETTEERARGPRDTVDETSDESFPASDPPSWTPQRGVQADPESLAREVEKKKRVG